MTARKAGFRPDIEGLRGLAVLLVVLYHAAIPGFSGGYVGVDVFFVISGYLITGLLMSEARERGRIDYPQFYARRARRLLPAAALTLVVTLLVSRVVYAPLEQIAIGTTAIAAAAFASNLLFIYRSTDYLGASAGDNPLLHTWSLAVEEQFYLVWPLVIGVVMHGASLERGGRRLIVLMAALFVISFCGGLWLTRTQQPIAFFSSPTRAWEFAVGGLALAFERRRLVATSWLLPLFGLLAILGASALFTRYTPFPGIAALMPVLGAAAVLASGRARPEGAITRALGARGPRWLGGRSYSWYLWHWPVLVLAEAWFGPLTFAVRVACVVFSLLLAMVTLRLVENPVRFSRKLTARPWLSLATGGALAIFGIFAGGLFRHASLHAMNSGEQRQYARARDALPTVDGAGCHVPYAATTSPACVFGDTMGRRTIVLFGDSHAAEWFTALDRIAKDSRVRLVSLTKSSCPAASISIVESRLSRRYVECDRWRAYVINRIVASRPQLVVLSSSHDYIAADTTAHVSPDRWLAGLRATLTRFGTAGIPTLLIRDTPLPGFDPLACLARREWTNNHLDTDCSFPRDGATSPALWRRETEVVRGIRGGSTADLTGLICDGERCDAQRGPLILYRDRSHLTVAQIERLVPALRPYVTVTSPAASSTRAPR